MATIQFETVEAAKAAISHVASNAYPFGDETPIEDGTVIEAGERLFAVVNNALWSTEPLDAALGINVVLRSGETTKWRLVSNAIQQVENQRKHEVHLGALRAKRLRLVEKIAEAVGPRASVDGNGLKIDGGDVYLDTREDRSGKLALTVRDGYHRGATHRFPGRKDGSHDYAKIAEILLHNANRQKAEAEARSLREANKKARRPGRAAAGDDGPQVLPVAVGLPGEADRGSL